MELDMPSDSAMARRLGVTPQHVSDIMCGRRTSKRLMERMANLLDIPESDLLDDDPQPQEPTPGPTPPARASEPAAQTATHTAP